MHLSSPSHFHFVSAEYVVEFEDQGLIGKGWEELKRVDGNKKRVALRLWPYISYRFRVIAINEVGKSDPSKPSEIHNTPAEGKNHNSAIKAFFNVQVKPDNIKLSFSSFEQLQTTTQKTSGVSL